MNPSTHRRHALRLLAAAAGLAALPALLNEDGVLILEIGHERAYFEAAFPQLAPVWLTTSMGCEQVLLLTREALLA